LLLAFLLVVGLTGIVGIFTGLSFISRTVLGEAMRRVEIDLGGAWAAFDAEKARVQGVVSMVSQGPVLREVLRTGKGPERACGELETFRRRYDLDILDLVDARGMVVARARAADCRGDSVTSDPVVARALRGEAGSGTLLTSREALQRESGDLADRAYIPLVYTEHAVPTSRTVEDRGMVLEAAIPILEGDEVKGAVCGGVLLNRKFALVDRIRDTVFGNRSYEGKPVGTVTLFLGDVRIATNVMLDAGTRALGTRVSEEVYRKVLERGERFADRAFVVNDWYLSAYDPIRDPSGRTIGIIYVGLLEKAYLEYRSDLARKYLGTSLLAALLSVGAALYLSGFFRRPVARLLQATQKLSAGTLATRVDVGSASREMVELGQAFNAMAGALEARTRELEETSRALQKAYSEVAERNRAYLETLGFVTHELKSPLASIVFGIGSLRERLLGPITEAQEAALRSAANSADYLNSTIANYLNLSRLEEGSLTLSLDRVALQRTVLTPVLERLSELAKEHGMRLACEVPEGLVARCDPALVASVVQNLLSNAVKYGRQGGLVRVAAKGVEDGFITVSVWNEGPGFAPETADRLFQKFSRLGHENADTKSGTGLGLFVSKQIVEKHGGRIWAESEPGRWARFSFTLPAAAEPRNG
jgi:two-component system NtrC family sensor kinase